MELCTVKSSGNEAHSGSGNRRIVHVEAATAKLRTVKAAAMELHMWKQQQWNCPCGSSTMELRTVKTSTMELCTVEAVATELQMEWHWRQWNSTQWKWWQQSCAQWKLGSRINLSTNSTVTATAKNKVLYNLQSTSGDGFSDSDNTNKVSGDSNHNS